jgi:putative flippase GtrA
MWLAFKYAIFAGIATLVNILSQDITIRLYNGMLSMYVSIAVGTLTGLVTKYVLDKKFIFVYRASSLVDDGATFIAYSVMGLATTLIFWGTELGFEFLFGSKWLRYLGAVIGLTIGYAVKYRLDKHFVFIKSP